MGMGSRTSNPQDLLTIFFFHWVVITLTLILRDLNRLQQEAKSLGQHWAHEVRKGDRRRPSGRRNRRKK